MGDYGVNCPSLVSCITHFFLPSVYLADGGVKLQ